MKPREFLANVVFLVYLVAGITGVRAMYHQEFAQAAAWFSFAGMLIVANAQLPDK